MTDPATTGRLVLDALERDIVSAPVCIRNAAAIEALRRCAQALSGELSAEERERICQLHEETLRALSGTRHRTATRAVIADIARMEKRLAEYPPTERAAAIMARTGLGRSRYFELRRLALQSGLYSGLKGDKKRT